MIRVMMTIIIPNLCSGPCTNCFWTRFGCWLRRQRSGHCSGQFDDDDDIYDADDDGIQMLTNIAVIIIFAWSNISIGCTVSLFTHCAMVKVDKVMKVIDLPITCQ